MRKPRQGVYLALEARRLGAPPVCPEDHFQGNDAPQARLLRFVNDPHAPFPKPPENRVARHQRPLLAWLAGGTTPARRRRENSCPFGGRPAEGHPDCADLVGELRLVLLGRGRLTRGAAVVQLQLQQFEQQGRSLSRTRAAKALADVRPSPRAPARLEAL